MGFFSSNSPSVDPLFTGPQVAGLTANSIFFGRGSRERRKQLRDFLSNPLPLSSIEEGGFDIIRDALESFPESIELLEGLFAPTQELVDTGFRTDIAPIVDAETRRFFRETIPDIAERFGSALSGSGFQQATSDAAADLGFELGATQSALDENAAARRITGLTLAPSIFEAPTAAGLSFGGAFADAGSRERAALESVRPGARLADSLGFLSGLETQQGFQVQPGSPSDFSAIVSGLSQITAPVPTSPGTGAGNFF